MLYAGLLFGVTVTLFPGASQTTDPPARHDLGDALRMQLVGLMTLTGPVMLVFAWLESRRRGATLGKRLLKLSVRGLDARRVTFPRSLARNALKFLPWEISHAGVHQAFVESHPQPWVGTALSGAGMLLAAVYAASCVVCRGRTLYDRASGTRVSGWTGHCIEQLGADRL